MIALGDGRPQREELAAALPAGAGLWESLVNAQVFFADDLDLVYVQNNKAACSTAKQSLLRSILPPEEISDGALHHRTEGPFATQLLHCDGATIAEVLKRPIFTLVRNPYTRVLSGYLNKVRSSDHVSDWFHRRYFLKRNVDDGIGFLDFLRCVASDHPRRIDPHFAPQYVNTIAHHTDFDFLGSVEDIGGTADYLRGRSIPLKPFELHATKAAAHLDAHFSEEAERLVETLFGEDFRFFGYSRGLAGAHEPPHEGRRISRRGVPLRAFAAGPDRLEQPGTREIEAWRRFRTTADRSEKLAIAESALNFDDWLVVEQIAHALIGRNALDLACGLMDRLVILLTRHMDHVPKRLLTHRGKLLKCRRERLLAQ